MAKTSFLMLIIAVLWSVTPTFYFFWFFPHCKELSFCFGDNAISPKHCVNLKNRINKSKNVHFPIRGIHNSILFISKLSSVTVGFLWEMDSACPKEHATEILSDSDHSTKVASTTLSALRNFCDPQLFIQSPLRSLTQKSGGLFLTILQC